MAKRHSLFSPWAFYAFALLSIRGIANPLNCHCYPNDVRGKSTAQKLMAKLFKTSY